MKTVTFRIPDDRNKLYEVIKYPAGEIQVRLTEKGIKACQKKEEYVIHANPIPDIIELAQLKDALDGLPVKFYFKRLELPYLPYGRADRRFVTGDCFGLHVFATLLNALKFHTVNTFDAHSLKVAKTEIPNLINIDPIIFGEQIQPVIKHIGKRGLVLISPDKGARERYNLSLLDLPMLEGSKIREPKTGALTGFSIDKSIKKFRKGLIIDDICDGGGTFVGLGEKIHQLNPGIELSLYVSHGMFSQGFEKLDAEFKHIFISDWAYQFPGREDFRRIR